jgi:hypothetical protein
MRSRVSGYDRHMPDWKDEEDWVGEPPEGRHTRDMADPDFWRRNWPASVAGAGVALALLILLIVLLG